MSEDSRVIEDLRKKLETEGIRPDAYCIGRPLADERYCLLFDQDNKQYECFYYERGQKAGLMTFLTENEACEHFLEMMLNSTTARS